MKTTNTPETTPLSAVYAGGADTIVHFVSGVTEECYSEEVTLPLAYGSTDDAENALRVLYGAAVVSRFLSEDHGVDNDEVELSLSAALTDSPLAMGDLLLEIEFGGVKVGEEIAQQINDEGGLRRLLTEKETTDEHKLAPTTYMLEYVGIKGERALVAEGAFGSETEQSEGTKLAAAVLSIAIKEMQKAGPEALEPAQNK